MENQIENQIKNRIENQIENRMKSQNLKLQTENVISQLILPDHIIVFHILNQNSDF